MKTKTKKITLVCTGIAAFALAAWPVFVAQAKQAPTIQNATITNAAVVHASDPASLETIHPLSGSGEIQSGTLHPDFPFNGIIANWPSTLPIGGALQLQLQVHDNGAWSDWVTLDPVDDAPTNAKLPEGRMVSNPIFFLHVDQFSYRFIGDVGKATFQAFRDVSFTYIDSRTPERQVTWLQNLLHINQASAEPLAHIVTRSEWGANEQYRYSGTHELWPPTYAPVEKLIIHHTAGSNGGSDPAAVVRGIYYFHAVTLGWGDIGYNYLIDPSGKIYEGRFGGDGVVGGHTYNDQEHTDYNRGTIGVAFLGNFESDALTDAARDSVTSLLAEKAQLFSIAPTGTSTFHNRQNLPNIIGHRDVDATTCPGRNLYAQLSSIRTQTQTKFDALPPLPTPQLSAHINTATPIVVTLGAGTTTTAVVQVTNTSNIQWQSYIPSRQVTLRPLVVPSQLFATGWESQDAVTEGDAANVPAGSSTTFTIPIAPPEGFLQATESFALFTSDHTELPGTRFQVSVQVLNANYAGMVVSAAMPTASYVNMQRAVTVQVQNLGTETWNPGDVKVNVTDIDGRTSQYRAKNWPNASGGFPVPTKVAPGETATLSLAMKTPARPGVYANLFTLKRANGQILATVDTRTVSRADSPWQAAFLSKKFPLAVKTGWNKTMIVKYKNTGITTWTRKLALRVYDSGFRPSKFSFPGWGGGNGRFYLQEKSVPPGKTGTFIVKLRSPKQAGLYQQVLNLEVLGSTVVVQNNTTSFLTRVDR